MLSQVNTTHLIVKLKHLGVQNVFFCFIFHSTLNLYYIMIEKIIVITCFSQLLAFSLFFRQNYQVFLQWLYLHKHSDHTHIPNIITTNPYFYALFPSLHWWVLLEGRSALQFYYQIINDRESSLRSIF